jgi:endoribonuclease Dicer
MARAPPALKRWTQTVAVKKTGAFPPMSLDDSNDAWHSDSEDDEDHFADYIKDPTMSGRIYPQDSVGVIYRYLSKLSQKQDAEAIQENVFEFAEKPGAPTPWVCNLVFSPGAPLSVVQGPASVSQVAAKRAVCFKACQDLYEKGLLSYEFFPRPKEVMRKLRPIAVFVDEEEEQTKGEVLPTLPPAPMPPNTTPDEVAAVQAAQATEPTVSQTVTGTRCYKRKKPEFWANTSTVYLGKWYPTIITVDRNHNPEKPYRPVVVFTRRALPTISDFKLYFSRMPSIAYLRPGLPVDIDEGRMQLLHRYTLRAMRSIVNKAYTCEYNDMPFFIAPLSFDWDIQVGMMPPKWPFPNVLGFIPWEQVMFAAEQYLVPLRTETLQALEADIQDSIIQDRWTEFTRRYDCIRVRPELNPLSKLDNTDVGILSSDALCLVPEGLGSAAQKTRNTRMCLSGARRNARASRAWLTILSHSSRSPTSQQS